MSKECNKKECVILISIWREVDLSFNRNIFGSNSKDEILTLVKSKEFKDIFLKHNIRNVIIFLIVLFSRKSI